MAVSFCQQTFCRSVRSTGQVAVTNHILGTRTEGVQLGRFKTNCFGPVTALPSPRICRLR